MDYKRGFTTIVMLSFLLTNSGFAKTKNQNSLETIIQETNQKENLNELVVKYALETKGTPYKWKGRNPNISLDCLGLTSYAYGKTYNIAQSEFPEDPFLFPNDRLYGMPVSGLDGILWSDFQNEKHKIAKAGDFMVFLKNDYHQGEKDYELLKVTTIDGAEYGGWHTGIYDGHGGIIHAWPKKGVIRTPISLFQTDAVYIKRR